MSSRFPLASDLEGNPVELPAEAVAWRVRRRSGKQGRPQCVYDLDTGAQLELQLDASLDELRDYGPGVYRLDAVDKEGKMIPGVVAQTEVPLTQPTPADANEPYGTKSEAAALIRHLVDANVRTMQAMASAFGQVHPAPHAPAMPPAMMEPAENGSASGDAQNWMQLLPLVPQLIQQVVVGLQQVAGAAKQVATDSSEGVK